MFQLVQMREEKVIIYSNNSLQCGYLNNTILPKKAFNIIQFQHVKCLGIMWNPHLPPVNHQVIKTDPTKLPDE